MGKYVFKPYSLIFPELFRKERARIASKIGQQRPIEHVGSTAVPGLGGKGIIDIGVAVSREEMDLVSAQLQELGYEFKSAPSTPDRFYFVIDLPDPEEGERRYHLHLMHGGNREWREFIGFRDYLRSHPEEVEEYAAIKRAAVLEANQDGKKYRKMKEPIFKKVGSLVEEEFVRRLIGAQFPEWKDLSVRAVAASGWDNRTFRLGDRMVVRMPSGAEYALQVEKEQQWLPKLAPFLPVPIPKPLAMGKPMDGYLWSWSIYSWLEGEPAASAQIDDLCLFAADLADFLKALEAIDATGGPSPGLHSFYRGGALMTYDREVREALATLRGKVDEKRVLKVWDAALASSWNKKAVWVHGDISPGNLLVKEGRLAGVIDFGQLVVGDPACDLAIAWTFFSGNSRQTFRDHLGHDDATWARARGWVLWKALIIAAGSADSNNFESERCWAIIEDVLKD